MEEFGMLFPSEVFLFVFLPVCLAVYYIFLRRTNEAKNIFLLAASLFFYAWGEPVYVFLMMGTILINWGFGLVVSSLQNKRAAAKGILFLMVSVNVGILAWFKYSTFFMLQVNRFLHTEFCVPQVALPIGISFFTFQAMSYVFDIYRGKGKVQRNPLRVGLYISLFPQLIAGPIVRYETIAEQMEGRKENWDDFCDGVTRFGIGLGKKVLIANQMAVVADAAFSLLIGGQFQESVCMAWLGAISYSLQIFFDFSGYSDMAIGLGKMFGFHFEENFNYPYMASSVSDFWRRWHISLQTWFRDYVYFPLGGSRVNKWKMIRNLFIVWALTGIWHGANWTFLAWGLMYFALLTTEKLTGLHKKNRWWGHIYTLFFVMIGWVIFRSEGMGKALTYIGALFGAGAKGLTDSAAAAYLKQYGIYYAMAVIGCFPLLPMMEKRWNGSAVYKGIYILGVLAAFVLSVSFIMNQSYNPFIYFNF